MLFLYEESGLCHNLCAILEKDSLKQHIHKYDLVKMKLDPRFVEYCKKADEVETGVALDRLFEIFIDACGVSIGERTIAVDASFLWMEKYKEENPEIPSNLGFKGIMALRSEEYRNNNKESIDKYDIAMLDPLEIMRICYLMLDDYKDETTKIALCAGVLFYINAITDCDEDY